MTGLLPMLTGTAIFWTWFGYPNLNGLELWGIWTIIISGPLCIAGLVITLIYSRNNKEDIQAKRNAVRVATFILCNIPLAIFYILFAFYMMDTERITINNNSDAMVHDIHIFGVGDNDKIDKIEKGQSKTVWVHMTQEGSIKMKYTQNGQIDTTCIIDYTGPLMGGNRLEYQIKRTYEIR